MIWGMAGVGLLSIVTLSYAHWSWKADGQRDVSVRDSLTIINVNLATGHLWATSNPERGCHVHIHPGRSQ